MSERVLEGEVVSLPVVPVVRRRKATRPIPVGGIPKAQALTQLREPWWDRQPRESDRQFACFIAYRELGPLRTLGAAARAVGVQAERMTTWSGRFRWRDRAAAFDEEQERIREVARVKAIEEMAERHAQICTSMLHRAVTRLAQIRPENLEARDVARFIDVAIRNERLARGEPTEIQKGEHTHRHMLLTDAELDAFERGA